MDTLSTWRLQSSCCNSCWNYDPRIMIPFWHVQLVPDSVGFGTQGDRFAKNNPASVGWVPFASVLFSVNSLFWKHRTHSRILAVQTRWVQKKKFFLSSNPISCRMDNLLTFICVCYKEDHGMPFCSTSLMARKTECPGAKSLHATVLEPHASLSQPVSMLHCFVQVNVPMNLGNRELSANFSVYGKVGKYGSMESRKSMEFSGKMSKWLQESGTVVNCELLQCSCLWDAVWDAPFPFLILLNEWDVSVRTEQGQR